MPLNEKFYGKLLETASKAGHLGIFWVCQLGQVTSQWPRSGMMIARRLASQRAKPTSPAWWKPMPRRTLNKEVAKILR